MESKDHSDESITSKDKLLASLVSLGLVAYGGWGAFNADLPVPLKDGRVHHITGAATGLTFGASLFAAAAIAISVFAGSKSSFLGFGKRAMFRFAIRFAVVLLIFAFIFGESWTRL